MTAAGPQTPASHIKAAGQGQDNNVPLVQLIDVCKVFSSPAGDFPALKNVHLTIHAGEFLGIVGKSGAGKSTLLNMIAGISQVTTGQVIFQKLTASQPTKTYAINTMSEDEAALWRGKYLGMVYQSFELLPMLDLVDNVMLPQDFSGRYVPKASRQQALAQLERVELAEHAHKLPSQISGGQKQRVAIARALANEPALILADEPTGNLDSVTAGTIFRLFEQLVAEGKTVVMVTHDQDLAPRFSRLIGIRDGRLIDGRTADTVAFSAGQRGRDYDGRQSTQHDLATATEVREKNEGQTNGSQRKQGSMAAVSSIYDSLTRLQTDRSKPAIVLRDVLKTYVSEAGSFTALRGIDLQLNYGQFISIVGKSGSGKSTLLNMITGIDHPTGGEVLVDQKPIYEMSESQRALWRGRQVGIVFQFFQLLPMLTLLENVMLPMDYTGTFPFNEREERSQQLLAMVGLAAHAHKLPGAVSSGQQQSAAIARALATDPPIVVADEPTGNLDSRSAETIITLFEALSAKGKTIVIVTHDRSLTARSDKTLVLADGQIVDRRTSPPALAGVSDSQAEGDDASH